MEKEKLTSFQCNVCGYIYKSKEENLPDDFICPLCEASKEQFTKLEDQEVEE